MSFNSIKNLQPSFKKILIKNLKYLILLCLGFIVTSFLSVYPTNLVGKIVNSVEKTKTFEDLRLMIFLYLVVRLIHLSISIGLKYFEEYIKSKMEYELRTNAISKVVDLDLEGSDKLQTTQFVTRIFEAIHQLVSTCSSVITWIGKSLTTLIFTFYFLIKIDPMITFSFIPLLIIMSILTNKASEKIRDFSKKEIEYSSYTKDFVQEVVSSLKEIKIFNCQDWIIGNYKTKEKNWRKAKMKYNFFSATNFWLLNLSGIIVVSFILFVGIKKTLSNQLGAGDITALLLYSGTIFMTVMDVFDQIIIFQTLEVSVNRFNEIMCKTNIKRTSKFENNAVNNYDVEINNLYFSYDKNNQVIKGIDLKIPFGKSVAIVGTSGSGKSTLLKLLLGLYVPDKGNIKIGGINIDSISEKVLRNTISCVFQNTFLYNDTVKNNIKLGLDKGDSSVEESACLSDAVKFIEQLPLKYDAIIDERGNNLSGGQQQRLGIARCLIRDAKILVLDEISASLDLISESNIIDSLNKLNDKTIITISHRPQMFLKADYIIVLEKGEIRDVGTHNELVERCEEYKKLIDSSS